MLKVFGCLTQEHNFWLVLLAGGVCLAGCLLTMRLLARMKSAPSNRRAMHVVLAGVIGGATIWTTHFVAMIAYDPGVKHAYDPVLTTISLFVAILGAMLGFGIAAYARGEWRGEAGGAVFGMSAGVMHYVGMQALLLPGRIEWDVALVAISLLIGAGLAAVAFNRTDCQVNRVRWYGGVAAMTLAICLMHFTGMGAIGIELDSRILVPDQTLSDETLTFLVVAVMSLFLMVGLSAFTIETMLREQAGADYRHATLHDMLTGLPNRQHLQSFLGKLVGRSENEPGWRFAVLSVDLDRFKEANDLHGHATGDAILKAVARRMQDALIEDEFIARSGGDEFVAVKCGYRRFSEVTAFAERLAGRIVEPVVVGTGEHSVGASIGIANFPEHGADMQTLLNHSDLAMYRAKELQIETICVFEAEMDSQNRNRIELTQDLRAALADDQFELHYQLQNDVLTRKPVGCEALLRWNHPSRGRVSPAEFIPLAEKTGLIRPIGHWVLRTACLEAASWDKPYRVAVNVAPQQLTQASFVEQVSDVLMESGLEPERLELEITEASIIDDHKNTLDVIHGLKNMGVRIAMDDFGTGYSSLASLRAFPFDKIKIDRSFIDGVHENPQSAAIVRSTLILGEALDIPVLAEGVESEEDLAFLGDAQCAEVQGFLFGKPVGAEELRRLWREQERRDPDASRAVSDQSASA